MGIPVMIMGKSGSGKTTSLQNFEKDEIGILALTNKELPFRKELPLVRNVNYLQIKAALEANQRRAYAIDDSQYLMAFEFFNRAKEKGYDKYTEIALHFKTLLDIINKSTDDDTIVYLLHHIEASDTTGEIKAKTIGKMLDEKLVVEGLFNIVLYSTASTSGYKFITQTDGKTTAKSPIEMFDKEIPNDLKFVDSKIREYWRLKPLVDKAPITSVKTKAEPKTTK